MLHDVLGIVIERGTGIGIGNMIGKGGGTDLVRGGEVVAVTVVNAGKGAAVGRGETMTEETEMTNVNLMYISNA